MVERQKQLEETLEQEISTRDEYVTKVRSIQADIETLEDTLKPVVMKKLKVLEHELIQAKVWGKGKITQIYSGRKTDFGYTS